MLEPMESAGLAFDTGNPNRRGIPADVRALA
jgi:hypothetical protein